MTLDELATELGYRPVDLRTVIHLLPEQITGDVGDLDPAVEATIRRVVTDIAVALLEDV